MPPNNQDEQEQKGIIRDTAERKGKKLIRDKALKYGKAAGKAAFKLVGKIALGVGKSLLAVLGTIGLPYALIVGGVVLAILIMFIAASMFFIDAPDSLDEENQELREFIMETADNTVDMNKPEQIPYRVPHEILIVAAQIYDSSDVKTRKAITQLAEALKPIFTYETHEGETVTITTTCVDGSCSTSESTSKFEVVLLVKVEAWDRIMTAEVKKEKSPWESSTSSHTTTSTDDEGNTTSSTTTVTTKTQSDIFYTLETIEYDYTLFERELSKKPFKYEDKSKKTVEAIYEVVGGEIYYSEWLKGESIIISNGRGEPVGGDNYGDFDGTVTPGAGVPLEYMKYYLEAEKKYKVDWFYLAAIHFIETKFSTHKPMISSVGAEGHMQFMPCTWLGWNYSGCKGGVGGTKIPDSVKHDPAMIKKYGGFGVDANGDGKADPFDVKDAIFTAAHYLSSNGFSTNVNKAIRAYNHSDKYVADVNAKAKEFKNAATYEPSIGGDGPATNPGGFASPFPGQQVYMTYGVGPRYYAGSSKPSPHYGADLNTRPRDKWGVPVSAIADGTIVEYYQGCARTGNSKSRCGGGFGNHVKVMHVVNGKKYFTIYGHFEKVLVTSGAFKQGRVLGTMGSSGTSTRIHLHLEMYNGAAWNKANILHPNNYIPVIKERVN